MARPLTLPALPTPPAGVDGRGRTGADAPPTAAPPTAAPLAAAALAAKAADAPLPLPFPRVLTFPRVLRRRGDRLAVAAGVLMLGVLILAGQVLLPGGWARLGWLPVAAGLLVGLPQVPVDHLVGRWVGGRGWRPAGMAARLGGSLLAAARRSASGPAASG